MRRWCCSRRKSYATQSVKLQIAPTAKPRPRTSRVLPHLPPLNHSESSEAQLNIVKKESLDDKSDIPINQEGIHQKPSTEDLNHNTLNYQENHLGQPESSVELFNTTNSISENAERRGDSTSDDNMIKKKIPVDANINSDIQEPVPLTVRSSLIQAAIKQIETKETDTVNNISDTSDNETGSGKIKFQSTVEIFHDGEKSEMITRREGFRENVNLDSKVEIPNLPKSKEDISHLKNAFAGNDFLASVLTEESLEKVINAMQERKVFAGEIIIEEGEPGKNMYVSARGTYEVYIKNKMYSTFSDKRVFGELAILYNSKRMATIKAVTDGKLWVLQRNVYQQIIVKSAIKEFEQTLSFLKNVPLVNELNEESLTKIANLLKKEFFKTNSIIVQEGDPGDKFYIIRAGCVTITKEKEGKVSELGHGAFFGERALLTDDRRQATVIANAPGVECLTLTRPEFKKHFNDIAASVKQESSAKVKSDSDPPSSFVPPPNEYSDITLDDLERKETLGVGGFGRVELVQHKTKPKLTFALKYLRRIDMVQQDQVQHVFNERDIQISCNSYFIVRMYNTFKDSRYLYFLMESCLGGDLWTFLQKRKGRMVSEVDARFYAGCVLEAFAYLHERNYIYRDLKPENLLIDLKGYIKLTDFGFAKNLNSATKTYTFAGTPEYVAPEIIYNRGHDKSVDYWAFGILIYELLAGKTPFRTDDHTNMMTYNRILRGINSVEFPNVITKSAQHLIRKLCRPVPTDRLGNQKNGIEDIRTHKWFQGFEWNKLRNQTMKSPFIPKLSSNIDTKYFEKFPEDDDIPPEETNSFASF